MRKPNKRRTDLERTQQIILSVTSKSSMIKGFKNTSTREVALKANITQPNLYHYFKNRKELCLVVVEELTPCIWEGLVPIVSEDTSVEEELCQLVKVLLDEYPTDPFLMLNDMSQEMGPDYNHTLYQTFKKTYIGNIAAISKGEPETNCLQEGTGIDDVTRFILYNVSVLLSIEKAYQQRTVDDDVKKFIQFMLHGVSKDHK